MPHWARRILALAMSTADDRPAAMHLCLCLLLNQAVGAHLVHQAYHMAGIRHTRWAYGSVLQCAWCYSLHPHA